MAIALCNTVGKTRCHYKTVNGSQIYESRSANGETGILVVTAVKLEEWIAIVVHLEF